MRVGFEECQSWFAAELYLETSLIAVEEVTIELGKGNSVISEAHIFQKPPHSLNSESSKYLLAEVVGKSTIPVAKLRIFSK